MYYALASQDAKGHLDRIGSAGFSFSLAEAFRNRDARKLEGVYAAIRNLKQEYGVDELHVLTFPAQECWTALPKFVQDQPDEREAYLSVLMRGVNRQTIETTWHEMSNRDFRFLALRDRRIMAGFDRLGEIVTHTAYNSDFETGALWAKRPQASGSHLTICVHPGCLSVTSYLLGKLRGATFIRFEAFDDLPYLWQHSAQDLRWMQGLHEQILFYGVRAASVRDLLHSHLDSASDCIVMDNLVTMGFTAHEETYNFEMSQAFPAMIHAIYH